MGAGKPKLLLVAPSGAGKSTAGSVLASQGWLHIDLDPWRIDGLAQAGLVNEWEAFSQRRQPAALSAELSCRLEHESHAGVVLSLPSGVVFGAGPVRLASREGLRLAVLFVGRAGCLAAFLGRERAVGRKLDERHWESHSADPLQTYAAGIRRVARHGLP